MGSGWCGEVAEEEGGASSPARLPYASSAASHSTISQVSRPIPPTRSAKGRTTDGKRAYSQGYIHCMPYGNVAFVTKLSPLHPGYVTTVCASTAAARHNAASDATLQNMAPTVGLNILCTVGQGAQQLEDGSSLLSRVVVSSLSSRPRRNKQPSWVGLGSCRRRRTQAGLSLSNPPSPHRWGPASLLSPHALRLQTPGGYNQRSAATQRAPRLPWQVAHAGPAQAICSRCSSAARASRPLARRQRTIYRHPCACWGRCAAIHVCGRRVAARAAGARGGVRRIRGRGGGVGTSQ